MPSTSLPGMPYEAPMQGKVRHGGHPAKSVPMPYWLFSQMETRQLPDLGQVEALVEGALVDGAVAEVAQHHPAVSRYLIFEGHAGGHGDLGAHDAVAAEQVAPGVEEVHRAALAPGAARGLAEQLGHQRAFGSMPQARAWPWSR